MSWNWTKKIAVYCMIMILSVSTNNYVSAQSDKEDTSQAVLEEDSELSGSGTESSPYIISNASQRYHVRELCRRTCCLFQYGNL